MSAAQELRDLIASKIDKGQSPEYIAEDIVRALRFGGENFLVVYGTVYKVLEASVIDSEGDEIAWTVYATEEN